MKALSLSLVALVLLWKVTSYAQDPEATPSQQANARLLIWKCETPAGAYSVAVRAMKAVSLSEYIVDNSARVFEVNIDTDGNLLPRFYYLEPLTLESPMGIGQATINKAQEIVEEAADRTGQSAIWSQTVKNYPATTHAHTVEYRVDTKQSLERIYQSAERAFRTQRPDTVKLQ